MMGDSPKSSEIRVRARRVLPGGVNSNVRLAEQPVPPEVDKMGDTSFDVLIIAARS